MLKTDRVNEAMEIILSVFKNYRLFFGDTHYRTAEMLCLRAMAHAINEDRQYALKDFAEGIPRLFAAQAESEINYLKKQRIQAVDQYAELSAQETRGVFKIPGEDFRYISPSGGRFIKI